jgi:Mn2+/Fe2+ NRAMP family transporter
MLVGFVFGISGSSPIPIILLAQTFNGILLPISALFLLRMMNEKRLLPHGFINTPSQNLLMIVVVSIAVMLGLHSLGKVIERLTDFLVADGSLYFTLLIALSFGIVLLSYFAGKPRS